jgi:hypothetical protein
MVVYGKRVLTNQRMHPALAWRAVNPGPYTHCCARGGGGFYPATSRRLNREPLYCLSTSYNVYASNMISWMKRKGLHNYLFKGIRS